MSAPKVLIQNQGPLGGAVEQVSLDTNRVNVQGETTSRLANIMAISSRGCWVDISQWLSYSAAVFSVANLALVVGAPVWSVLLSVGLPVLIFMAMMGSVIDKRPSLMPSAVIRYGLIFIGVVIAIV